MDKAWGETRYTSGTTPTTYHFTGQREDATIGLYFYNARYYDPYLNRWIQPDTIIPDFTDPQSLNRNSYVKNNPLKYIDPSGHADQVGEGGAYLYQLDANPATPADSLTVDQRIYVERYARDYTAADWIGMGAVGAAIVAAPEIAAAGSKLVPAVVSLLGKACQDGDCTNEATSVKSAIENGLTAIRSGVGQGFSSFDSFKYHMGSAGEGYAWHHIVQQLESNISRFGAQAIHNTNNLIRLPDRARQIHREITAYCNSIQPRVTGSETLRVYEWLATLSFEEQWQFGIDLIMQFGGEQYILQYFGG